jgi:7-cyano-7-deazaguanine synthase in queuosine biosynthesis
VTVEHLFLCGTVRGSKRAERGREVHRLALHGSGQNVNLKISNISQPLVRNISDPTLDLLDIAAYVYAADQAVSRGGRVGRGVGRDWHRSMRLVVPVRLPGFWNQRSIGALVNRTLSFLAGEQWKVSFEKLHTPPSVQTYIDFGDQWKARPETVLLFSGGLDSLGGLVQEIEAGARCIALVTHRSNPKTSAQVKRLVGAVRDQVGGSVELIHIPVWADKSSALTKDTSQRTRSFLYAALGMAVAAMTECDTVRLYENGIVSLHLPIIGELVGARASRSTHPCAMGGFDQLLQHLIKPGARIENPFLWLTKVDVVKLIRESAYAPLIGLSESCGGTFKKTKTRTHCGECSQCVDRRLAIVGAEATAYEDANMYAQRIELGVQDGPARTMVGAYLKTARQFLRLDPAMFVATYPEVHRAASCLPGSADQAVEQIVELCRRHGKGVTEAIAMWVKDSAGPIARGEIPPSSALLLGVERADELGVGPQYEAWTAAGRKIIFGDEYSQLTESSGSFDVFIDGTTLRVEQKLGGDLKTERLSSGEFDILCEYVESRKLMTPIMTRFARRVGQSEGAANGMFKRGRRKVDARNEQRQWALFKTRKGGWDRPTQYRFDPDKPLKYCILRPL